MKVNTQYYSLLFALLLAIPCGLFANAELEKFTEKIHREFDVSSNDANISITNKYGNVDIITTTGSKMIVDIEIIIEAKSSSRFKEILDKIDIRFNEIGGNVNAYTDLDNNNGSWFKNNENYKINWKVQLPKNSDLTLDNKYGDISLTDLNNNLDITLKYGNGHIQNVMGDVDISLGYSKSFSIGDINGETDLDLSYSNIKMGRIRDIDITSKYSDIEIDEAINMDIESSYDDFIINKAANIENTGKYDDFRIGTVGTLDLETKYTDIRVDILAHKLLLSTGYGKVRIGELSTNFESVIIETQYTGIDITTKGAYDIAFHGKYTGTDFPDDLNINYRDKDNNELTLKGKHKSGGKGRISAEMRYGHLNLHDR